MGTTNYQHLFRQVGRRIRNARVAAGLTQRQAAKHVSLDYKRWQKLEQGIVNPTVKTLARVAQALGMSFWALLSEDLPRARQPDRPGQPREQKPQRDKGG